MRKKKLVVAVLDSGVNLNLEFLKNKNIKSIKLENGEVKETNEDTTYHGTKVCSYIYKECQDVNIISIQVLNKKNKCSLDDLIEAIDYCININVDIINLSLGICGNIKEITKLKEVCDKAISMGIVIFSANNNYGKVAYPANFKNVISVDYNLSIKDKNYEIDKKMRNIVFYKVNLDIDIINYRYYNRGNSFLVPYLVGVFCCYIKYFNLNSKSRNIQDKFIDFLDSLEKNYRYRIFNMLDNETFSKKSIFYPLNDTNEKFLYNYESKFNIVGYHKLKNENYKTNINSNKLNVYNELTQYRETCSSIIVGEITPDSHDEINEFNKIISYAREHKLNVFIRNGYLSTFERYLFSKETGKNINCQYI